MPPEQLPTQILTPTSWTQQLSPREIFGNSDPVEIDAGCGKGRFLIARGKSRPETNFLGIERLLGRLRKVDKKVARGGLANVRLLRVEVSYAVEYLLPPGSVSVINIFFPDPWPKRRHHRRRLFNAAFVDSLVKCLAPDGVVHFATDHLDYFEAVKELVAPDTRFESITPFEPTDEEQTDFELGFRAENRTIGRLSLRKRAT